MTEKKDFLPVYRETLNYAKENGELSPYRVSQRENIACKDAIEKSIDAHFDGMHFDPAAVKEVLEEYGRSRTLFVLAVTVQAKDWDGRFSSSNKEWAKSFHIQEDMDSFGGDRRSAYVVSSHSVLINAFINETRKELARKPSVMAKLAENADLPKATAPTKEKGDIAL